MVEATAIQAALLEREVEMMIVKMVETKGEDMIITKEVNSNNSNRTTSSNSNLIRILRGTICTTSITITSSQTTITIRIKVGKVTMCRT